jgi:fucose 4-O-acetylase-like acetyltransferase
MQQTGIPNNQRLVGLDAWRAVLLVLGVALHAASSSAGWEQWVGVATHKFRMEAFFAISGLLAAFTLPRQSVSKWLTRRWISLGVPTLVVMASLNALTPVLDLWSEQRRFNQAITAPVFHFPLLHLWFLPVLLACSTLLAGLVMSPTLMGRVDRAVGYIAGGKSMEMQRLRLILVTMLVALVGIGLDQAYTINASNVQPAGQLARFVFCNLGATSARVPYYSVFYFLGWLIGTRPDMADICLRHRKGLVALIAVGVASILVTFWYKGSYVFPYADENLLGGGRTFGSVTKAMIGVPATLLILSHAVSIKRVPRALGQLSQSSYTIYLVHVFLLAALSAALGSLGWGTTPRYLLLVLLTVMLGHQAHVLLVKRSAVLGFLLNGTGRLRDIVPLPVAEWKGFGRFARLAD